jgi:HEPN/Toprim N-terminal domain 1
MGSYAYLRVGDLVLTSTKSEVDPTVLMLFTEADKRTYVVQALESDDVTGDDTSDESFLAIEYAASLAVVKDRLEFMGFTLQMVEKAFIAGVQEHIAELSRRREDLRWAQVSDIHCLLDEEELVLRGLSLRSWLDAFAFIIREKLHPDRNFWYNPSVVDRSIPSLVRYLLGNSFGEGVWFPGYDFRVFMRAAVEITGTAAEVVYDLAELAEAEAVSIEEDLCSWARRETADELLLNHKVVVLTEGRSDIEAIEDALHILWPHLTEYYSFMDFEGVRAPGGAGPLVATIKAFIGAGIVNRIVALFDNDTAARSALRGLRDVQLPSNVRVLHYPDVEWARDYPTLGPQGVINMDVNGLAASLEMYFGLDVLREEDGSLTPVQWRGYDDGLKQYQGEILNKVELQRRFANKLQECRRNPEAIERYYWTGMRAVIERLRTAFHDSSSHSKP